MTETARLNDYTPGEEIGVVARTEVQPGDHDWGGLTLRTSLRYEIGKRNPPTFADLAGKYIGLDPPD